MRQSQIGSPQSQIGSRCSSLSRKIGVSATLAKNRLYRTSEKQSLIASRTFVVVVVAKEIGISNFLASTKLYDIKIDKMVPNRFSLLFPCLKEI